MIVRCSYKNLHKNCWSIRRTDWSRLIQMDLRFVYMGGMKVNRKGRECVIREKRKNVHAGIMGYLRHEDMKVWDGWVDMIEITYNPYKYASFVDVETEKPRWFFPFANFIKKSFS